MDFLINDFFIMSKIGLGINFGNYFIHVDSSNIDIDDWKKMYAMQCS